MIILAGHEKQRCRSPLQRCSLYVPCSMFGVQAVLPGDSPWDVPAATRPLCFHASGCAQAAWWKLAAGRYIHVLHGRVWQSFQQASQ